MRAYVTTGAFRLGHRFGREDGPGMRSRWRAAQSERPQGSTREPAAVAELGAVYVTAMGGSHPLAKRVDEGTASR
jgi:hypothetical protein